MVTVSIVVPCYQNEGSIPALGERLGALMQRLESRAKIRVVFVDDGSTDGTLARLMELKQRWPDHATIVKLTRNFGSYNALLAGMGHSDGDCHVHLHADLQDPPELIDDMLRHYEAGSKLVIAYRRTRQDGGPFSTLYHWMVRRVAISNIPPGGFDLMLFDEQIRQDVLRISEKNTNTVYLISWLGYPYTAIPYDRARREAGTSQWRLAGKVRLFLDTFFSFSMLPVTVARTCLLTSSFAMIAVAVLLWRSSADGGMTTMMWLGFAFALMIFLLTVMLTVAVEYLNRVHETVRGRPSAVVDEVV